MPPKPADQPQHRKDNQDRAERAAKVEPAAAQDEKEHKDDD
jgi:hypothetical protein